jgi:hypothetical protein
VSGGVYLDRIAIAHALGNLPEGEVCQVTVAHDSDCPVLRRCGACSCDPVITATTARAAFEILPNGAVRRMGRA